MLTLRLSNLRMKLTFSLLKQSFSRSLLLTAELSPNERKYVWFFFFFNLGNAIPVWLGPLAFESIPKCLVFPPTYWWVPVILGPCSIGRLTYFLLLNHSLWCLSLSCFWGIKENLDSLWSGRYWKPGFLWSGASCSIPGILTISVSLGLWAFMTCPSFSGASGNPKTGWWLNSI